MLFRVRQQVPCVLSLMRSYKAEILSKKQLERALLDIEHFHFLFTAITSQRSSGGISSMYAALGRKIAAAQDSQSVALIVNSLRTKLRDLTPSQNEFDAVFPELIYTHKISKQRALVRYALIAIAKHEKIALPVDFDKITIEHLTPQSMIDEKQWTHEIVGQLGNLLLVPEELNDKLKDKDFATKKEILLKEKYPLSDFIRDAVIWTPDSIKERTKQLGQVAYTKVWKI